MKDVELYAKVRHAVRIEGLSRRAVARRFGIDPRTVGKMLEFSVPPGYRRSKPPVKPKLGPFIGIIDVILAEDKGRLKKQQHTLAWPIEPWLSSRNPILILPPIPIGSFRSSRTTM